MKIQHLSKSYTAKIQSIRDALEMTRDALTRAGKTIVEMLEENPDTFEILLVEIKGLTLPFLESLELIGLGKLDPLLLTDTCPAAQRAIAQCLPPKDQARLLTATIPVVKKVDGGFKTDHMKMSEINERQACLAIGHKLRTPEEQIEILKEQEASKAKRNGRFSIDGDSVRFREGAKFNYQELIKVAELIAPKAIDIESDIKRNQIAKK